MKTKMNGRTMKSLKSFLVWFINVKIYSWGAIRRGGGDDDDDKRCRMQMLISDLKKSAFLCLANESDWF